MTRSERAAERRSEDPATAMVPSAALGRGGEVRIVGGRFRGRALAAPDNLATRPTSDRVREAIFNILLHGIPQFQIAGAL